MLEQSVIDDLVALVRRKYPDWNSFSDPSFVDDEVAYKQATVAKAAELLSEERLRSLLTEGRYDAITSAIEKVGKDNNLLYLVYPRSGDLNILYDEKLDKEAFCLAFVDLLYGPGDSPERLDRYVDFIEASGLTNRWTFPTYFLFMCHPKEDVFVKPRVTQEFLKLVGRSDLYAAKPTGVSYRGILDLLRELGEMLAEYGPRDMVDLQSLLWVCGQAEKPEVESERVDMAEFIRRHGGEERLRYRRANRKKACELIAARGKEMTEEEFGDLLTLMDLDFIRGRERGGRFGQAFRGNNRVRMEESAEELIAIVHRLWTASEDQADAVLDDLWSRRIPAAGRLLGSGLMHLRDPEKFTFWSQKLHRGLRSLTEVSAPAKRSLANYLSFNDAAQKFRRENSVPPEAMDIVLTYADEIAEPAGEDPKPSQVFVQRAFELMGGLAENPTKEFYAAHKEEFKGLVERPFQSLIKHVASKLSPTITDVIETEKGVFARIQKNDWGRGGAWPFYWGAFYPKGGKRIRDAQLFAWMNGDCLDFGFFVGEYGAEERSRFEASCRSHGKVLKDLLEASEGAVGLTFGRGASEDEMRGDPELSLDQWLANPIELGARVGMTLSRDQVVELSADELSDRIAAVFEAVFPMFVAATEDDPSQRLAELIETDDPTTNPEIPVSQLASSLGVDEDTVERWVRSIERKKQAIFYGPPGTGKTYTARLLAEHLVGGGAGLVELVQFHPAYAYEDFMQGIRPRTRADGGLEYKVEQGRFLDFCRRAKSVRGRSVLIVDEINRAKLSSVFGELMYLLEYRDEEIPLAGGGRFRIPRDVLLIGTMNTADRSVALVDHALRRRFAFIGLFPEYETLRRFLDKNEFAADGLIGVLEELNAAINDRNYSIGISYFLRKDLEDEIEDIWQMEIEPYLEEYFFDQADKVEEFRWQNVAAKIQS